MRLNQALRYRKAKPHSGRGWIHAHEFFKDLLMIFGSDPTACIGDGYQDAI